MAIVGLGGEKLWLCPSLNDSPHDISGNGNNGTYNGEMGTVADVSKGGKRAYSFDGVDDYIDLTTSNVASSQNLNSFSLWINPDSINSVAVIINAGNASNGDRFINLGINSTQNILCGRSNDWLVAGNHSTSSWYHLCVISNGTTISLYKDGLLIGSRTDATVNFTETKCRIGGFILNTSNQYDGLMDDIRIFDRALTTAEIKHLAKARGITGTPLKKGLGDEKLWLCPSIDDSAEDLSGNGNNGTYNGGMGTVSDSTAGGSRAYYFDGSNDYISVPFILDPSQKNFTFSAWVNLETSRSDYQVIAQQEGTLGRSWLHNNASYATGGKRLTTSLSGTGATSSFTFGSGQEGNWYHVVITCTPSGQTAMWVDGTNYGGNVNNTIESSTSGMRFGNHKNTLSYGWNGLIDDIRIFDRVLTTSEITHLASARGVAGSPYGFEGLGDEKLWLCPTLDDSAEDISGNRHHGTYIAGMGTVADTSNGGTRAYSFNGTTHMLDVASPPSITGPSASISYWCKSNTSTTSWVSPGGYVTAGYDDYRLTWRKTNQALVNGFATYSTGGKRQTSSYSLSNFSFTDWTHYAVVADGGNVYFYVNGTLAGTGSGGSGNLNLGSTFTLGSQDLRSGGSWWNGYIDDCRVFDRALTQEEITHLAKSRGVLGSPYNLNGIVHLLSSFIHPFT